MGGLNAEVDLVSDRLGPLQLAGSPGALGGAPVGPVAPSSMAIGLLRSLVLKWDFRGNYLTVRVQLGTTDVGTPNASPVVCRRWIRMGQMTVADCLP